MYIGLIAFQLLFHGKVLIYSHLPKSQTSMQLLDESANTLCKNWVKMFGWKGLCPIPSTESLECSCSASAKRRTSSSDKWRELRESISKHLFIPRPKQKNENPMLRMFPSRRRTPSEWLCIKSRMRWYMCCSVNPESLTSRDLSEGCFLCTHSMRCFKGTYLFVEVLTDFTSQDQLQMTGSGRGGKASGEDSP